MPFTGRAALLVLLSPFLPLGFVRLAAASLLLFVGVAQAQPSVIADLALQDQHGRALKRGDLDGRVLLLNFVFAGCSSTCPAQTRELAELRRALPADVQSRTRFLSVTVDPDNDTPQMLAAFARRMGADLPGWSFAGGSARDVNRLIERMQALNTRQKPAQPESHRTSVYLYGANGQLVLRFAGVPLDRVRLADEITRAALKPPSSPSTKP